MTEIQVLGITTRRNIEFERSFCIMAFGDIMLSGLEVTLRGCALARSNGRIIALPPKIPGAKLGDLSAMQWNASGEFAQRVKEKLLEAYRKMGGEMPPATPEKAESRSNAARRVSEKPVRRFVAASEIDLDGTPATWARNERIGLALDRMSKRDGCYYYTEVYERTEPDTLVDEADDTEAAEGLHRVLGLDAVEETMQRAGL